MPQASREKRVQGCRPPLIGFAECAANPIQLGVVSLITGCILGESSKCETALQSLQSCLHLQRGRTLYGETYAKEAKEHCCKKEKRKELAFRLGTLAPSTGCLNCSGPFSPEKPKATLALQSQFWSCYQDYHKFLSSRQVQSLWTTAEFCSHVPRSMGPRQLLFLPMESRGAFIPAGKQCSSGLKGQKKLGTESRRSQGER